MLRSLILLASLLLNPSSASFVSAQTDSCSHRVFSVYVQDSRGGPVTGLAPSDFEATVHSKPVNVVSIAPDARPHRLVLIVDTSRSVISMEMGEPPRWRWEFALARHFFEENRQKAQMALLIFGKQINEVVDFSQGNPAVDDRLQQAAKGYDHVRKDPTGRTNLHDAILQGLQLFDHPSSADAVYVLTDGGGYTDNADPLGAAELIQRLNVTEVRLFAVVLQRHAGYVGGLDEEVLGPEELSKIARKSGGSILSTAEWRDDRVRLSANSDGKATNQETLARLYQAILQNSVLEIELPFLIEKNERFELRLSNAARRQWKGAHIIYSGNLIGCGSSASRN